MLIDTIESPTAGTERQLLQLLRRLDRTDFEPHLCVLRGSRWLQEEFDLAPLHVLDIHSFRSLRGWRGVLRLAALLRRLHTDVVHVHFRDASIAGIAAARLAKVPGVVAARRNQGYWLNPAELRLQRLLNRWVDVFLANSLSTRDVTVQREGLVPERVRVVYNGLDPERFRVCEDGERHTVRKSLGISRKGPVAGIVANLRPVKRLDVFLRAAALAREEVPGARFLVVGEGPQREALQRMARDLGLDAAVRFLGRRTDVATLMGAMDVGVLSSDSESFSNALVEYMASGLAVAATDVGGCREALAGGGVGRIVPVGDHVALGRAMAALLGDDDELCRARQRNAAIAAQVFSMQRFVDAHANTYRELSLQSRGNGAA
jgi:glycosyltransferase involved in cell wall biosynthesis